MISKQGFNPNKKECYCSTPELIENYDKAITDTTQTYYCHHRLEFSPFSNKVVSVKFLKEQGMYYHQPPEALIFLTSEEHNKLHNTGTNSPLYGKVMSEDTRKKMSIARKGKKHGPCSEEAKKKISEANIGKRRSDEFRKKCSERRKGEPSPCKGKHWKLVDGKRVYY